MKKKYISPEMKVIQMKMVQMLNASGGGGNVSTTQQIPFREEEETEEQW